MLLAARGTAGQLLLCSVLVWRAALRTVTSYRHTYRNLLFHIHICRKLHAYILTHHTHILSCFAAEIRWVSTGW